MQGSKYYVTMYVNLQSDLWARLRYNKCDRKNYMILKACIYKCFNQHQIIIFKHSESSDHCQGRCFVKILDPEPNQLFLGLLTDWRTDGKTNVQQLSRHWAVGKPLYLCNHWHIQFWHITICIWDTSIFTLLSCLKNNLSTNWIW